MERVTTWRAASPDEILSDLRAIAETVEKDPDGFYSACEPRYYVPCIYPGGDLGVMSVPAATYERWMVKRAYERARAVKRAAKDKCRRARMTRKRRRGWA